MGSRSKSWLFGAAVILCLCAAAFGVTVPIHFNSVSVTAIAELLATIFVVTLFMERAQEVILTTMRARGSEQLELTIRKFKRAIQRQKKIAPEKAIEEHFYDQLEDARIEKMDYRASTRVLALRVGLLFGLMISIAGVRSIGVLVDEAVLSQLSSLQLRMFNVVDVLLTGGVMAGGSDGIHKMTELYRSYVEINVKRNKSKKRELDVVED